MDSIQGVAYPHLSRRQLLTLTTNDVVVIKPPPSKADPFALVWGNRPIYGDFHPTDPANMARAIRDLFLNVHVDIQLWDTTHLFVDDDMQCLTGNFMDNMVKYALKALGLTDEEAKLYSPHSFRIYLACALKAAGKSDSEIQMMCRWQSLDSLRLYARMGHVQYCALLRDARAADSKAITVSAIPIIDSLHLQKRVLDMVSGDEQWVNAHQVVKDQDCWVELE